MKPTNLLRTAMAGLFAISVSPAAFAQSQCEEDTCPAGYTCAEVSYDDCKWDCPDGEECTVSDCETVQYTSCQPAACETDADCGGEMVCHTFTTNCATPGHPPCAPGEECPEPPPIQPCENTEYQQCTPRSQLPCEESSDCGEGFDCAPSVICSCPGGEPTPTPGMDGGGTSGSPGMGGASPGAAPAPPPTDPVLPGDLPLPPGDCTCEPSGTNYCQMQNIECEADSDCPTDWSCVESPGPCWADSEGNSGCSEGSSQCYPPSVPGGYPGNPTIPVPDGPTTPGSGEGDNGEDPAAPQPPRPGGGTGDGNGQGNGSSVGGLLGLLGCSVNNAVGAGSSTGAWTTLALGLGAALLRRRRH